MSNFQKGFAGIALIVAILLIVVGVLFYIYGRPQVNLVAPVATNEPVGDSITNSGSTENRTDYVFVMEPGINSSTLKFTVGIDPLTINSENVKVCTVSVSAGSAGELSCFNGALYTLTYVMQNKTLTITGNDKQTDKASGLFSGCASCSYFVELSGLKTIDGDILTTRKVLID